MAVIAHWNEFGPEHGFGELMDKIQGPSAPILAGQALAKRQQANETADKIIADYKEHYDFPWQGESHMHDCIMTALEP